MKLAEYQRTLVRLSFAREASEAEFRELGDGEGFAIYRHMIRARFLGMARVAFKGSCELVGEAAFGASFERYLASNVPRSPLIRDVIADFAAFARADLELLANAPVFARDLLTFEEAKWRVAYVAVEQPQVGQAGVRELDFEGAPVLNPALFVLPLGHAVHELAAGRCREGALSLLVYRPPALDEVRWYAADDFFAGLLAAIQTQPGALSLAELVRSVVSQQQRVLDETLLETLASALTLAVQRGVLIGVRG